MYTYILPESGPQRQQQWKRWHRWHPDTQQAIGTSSKAGTKPLDLWIIIGIIHKQKNHVSCFSWERVFSQLSYRRFYTSRTAKIYKAPKNPEDSRKLGSNTRQYMGHTGLSPGRMHWKRQPTGYQQKHDHNKEDGKSSHQCIYCTSGPQHEDHPLSGSTDPSSLTAESTAHTLIPAPSALTTWPRLFILRGQCLHNHQLTGFACDFQNAILSSKYNNYWKVWLGFYRLRGNSEFST